MASVTVNAATRNFTKPAGDTIEFPFKIYSDERAAVPQDITDWTAWLTVKSDIEDADEDAVFNQEFTPLEALTGQITLTMGKDDTIDLRGEYVYAVVIYNAAGVRSTELSGTLTFTTPVKQAV